MTTVGYVTSHAYSGSTLLAFLLGAHPDVATVGEMTGVIERLDPAQYACSCGQFLNACPFWLSFTAAMLRRGQSFDIRKFGTRFRARDHRMSDRIIRAAVQPRALELVRSAALKVLPGPRRRLRALLARNLAFIESVCEVDGGTVFVDISKLPGRTLHLRRLSELDVRIIHLIRDARGVMASSMKNMGIRAPEAAQSWCRELAEAERLRQQFDPERWLQLRYEDLCRKPDFELARVFRFIGVDPARNVRDLASVRQHILGNDMRLSNAGEIRLDETWRTKLNADDLAAYQEISGAANRRYGYDA